MEIDVAFLPSLLSSPKDWVCVVVDVLRASTSLATMFAKGLDKAIIAGSVEEARTLASEGDFLLCGERDGLPPPGFHYGNSPTEYNALDLSGHSAVFVTSNGTKALSLCVESPAVFVGSLVNATAVCRSAVKAAAAANIGVAFICAGNDYGKQFSLDDATACGLLVSTVEKSFGEGLHLGDGARAARRLCDSYSGQAISAFLESTHGAQVEQIGLGHDLTFCSQVDLFGVAPTLQRLSGDRLRLVRYV
jgi:2-phosphosulfolactate phosphatase